MSEKHRRSISRLDPSMRVIRAADIPFLASGGFYFHATGRRPLQSKPHAHDFYELIFVLSGACTHEINGVPYAGEASFLYVLRPGDVHRFTSQTPEAELLALSVTEEAFEMLVRAYGRQAVGLIIESGDIPVIQLSAGQRHDLLAHCGKLNSVDSDTRLSALHLMAGMSVQFILSGAIHPVSGAFPKQVLQAMEQMARPENITEGMPAFLRLSSYSHPQLCRVMKRYAGISPQDFILRLKMNYAFELLMNTDDSIHLVAEKVGYSSPSHFTKVFHGYFHITPSSVRRSPAVSSTEGQAQNES